MNIVMWTDLQCPFCYTGENTLQQAIEELGLKDQVYLDIKSHEIHRPEDGNGDVDMRHILEDKDGFTPEEAEAQIEKINRMAREEAGLDIDFGKARESNDHNAQRLYKLARDKGVGEAVRKALQEAYFVQGKVLADEEVLLEAARKGGLDPELVRRMLKEGWYETELHNDEVEYEALGIESVPYFIIDQEVVPEHKTREEFVRILKEHMDRSAKSVPSGSACQIL